MKRESLRLSEGVERLLCDAENAIDRTRVAIEERAGARVELSRADTEKTLREIALTAAGTVTAAGSGVEANRNRIERECEHQLAAARSDLQTSADALLGNAAAAQRQARTLVGHAMQTLVGIGPEATLRRGYAIARDGQGRPVGTKVEAAKHPSLRIQFRDGQLAVENSEYQGGQGDE